VGILFSYIFRVHSLSSGKIYGADLLGGATGALAVIFLLNIFGGVSTGILLGVSASIAALFFSMKGGLNSRVLALSLFTFVTVSSLCGVNLVELYTPSITVGKNPDKEIYDALSKFSGKIIRTKWSAFGRTDLLTFDNIPDHMDIYLDGTAGSPMYRFTGSAADPGISAERLKRTFPGYFPFLSLREDERRKALIIGAGGGRDILLALMGGVKKLTAVEINRDLVDLVISFADYNGGIYSKNDNVKVVIEEGRHFLKGFANTYDIIFLSLPVTNTSRSLEGYALTENFLFTTDSIKDYLDHLTNKGRLIVVTHNDMEALRLLTISLTALAERGITASEAMTQIYIVASEDYLVFVLKKTPFTPQDIRLRYRTMQKLPLDPLSSYFPYIRFPGALNPILVSLATGGITKDNLIEMVKKRGYDISPVNDNMPFFYKFDVGTPRSVAFPLWASLIALSFMIGYSFLFLRNKTHADSHSKGRRANFHIVITWNLLFMMVGAGFMAIEISMIQKFVLFLGKPILSLAVLLFSLLVGAGVGSYASSRVGSGKITRGIAYSSLGITLIILGYIFLLPGLFTQFLSLSMPARIGITLALLVPLGFVMGFPFPLGIRLLKKIKRENHIPWAWGVNGVSSVLGSALTITMAIHFGFTEALLFGASSYFVVFVTFLRQRSM
jgi:predicted membrane-bound spermidine synthase